VPTLRPAARAAALAAAALLALAAVPAAAHEGNPDYRSVVTAVTPSTPGLQVRVLDYDDRLELTNRSGRTVVIFGYNEEPYARVLGDGTVQVNERSPAVALNDDAGQATAPSPGVVRVAPQWRTLDQTGRIEWHDHRIHYRSGAVAPQVHDKSRRTKVFDYRVPLEIGNRSGAVLGTLTWLGSGSSSSSFPTGAVVSLAVLGLLAIAAVALVRRRRAVAGEPARAAAKNEVGGPAGVGEPTGAGESPASEEPR
jgi:MYXO-CTERM domain-containing protein